MKLLPKNEQFDRLLQKHTDCIVEAAKLLHGLLAGDAASLNVAAGSILELEHQGDQIAHELFVCINRSILDPLDPEEMRGLVSRLDDIIDGIEDCAYRLSAYRLQTVPSGFSHMAALILLCSQQVAEAVGCFTEGRDMSAQCLEIRRLENVADEIDRANIDEVVSGHADPIESMKIKEILEFLERTVDRCEDVADVFRNALTRKHRIRPEVQ
jgi:predicted phosphate transport protein (TIGR00153 family)